MPNQALTFTADQVTRLDKYLHSQIPHLSRGQIQTHIIQGFVSVNQMKITQSSYKLKLEDHIEISLQDLDPAKKLTAEKIPLNIIYEDEHVLVIDKQAGLVVHPAAGHYEGTLVHALLDHCGNSIKQVGEDPLRPGIVHRLDKDTSGLMVIAKTQLAFEHLKSQFQHKSDEESLLTRKYLALVYGLPSPSVHSLEGHIARHPSQRKKMAMVDQDGKYVKMSYALKQAYGLTFSLLECKLFTGRTHQIRVQLSDYGFPVLGDQTYISHRSKIKKILQNLPKQVICHLNSISRQMLHASELKFLHPKQNELICFYSNPSHDMLEIMGYIKNI